jgi:hypothetical protein
MGAIFFGNRTHYHQRINDGEKARSEMLPNRNAKPLLPQLFRNKMLQRARSHNEFARANYNIVQFCSEETFTNNTFWRQPYLY